MTPINIALLAVGTLVIGLGLLSRRLERMPFSPPLFALLLGIALGPAGLDLLDPHDWGRPERILEEAARLTLAIALMGIALRLPARYFFREWRSMVVILGGVMPLMCLTSGLLAHWILGVPILVGMLVGAVVTPTDPVVATSIVTGSEAEKNLPAHLRNTLSAESGANDGLAAPMVLLFVLLLTRPEGNLWNLWLLHGVLWKTGAAIGIGLAAGVLAGRLLLWAETKHSIEPSSFLAYTIALSLLVAGGAALAGTEGILAVFAAGVAYSQEIGGRERAEEENVQEAVNQFFTLPVFVLLGLMLPWNDWVELGWSGLALAVAVILLRRLPALILLQRWIPELKSRRETVFAGWFGPIGVAAAYYAVLAMERTGHEVAWHAGSLIICASLVAHGTTGGPSIRWYSRG